MMKEPAISEVEARKFLLGQLSPEEQGQIEELAFEDPDTFTLIESVEEDLIDEFLRDELSPLEKQRFEDHFLTFAGRRQDLEISQVLEEHFNRAEQEVIPAKPEKVDPDDNDRKFFLGRLIDSLKSPTFWLRAITAAAVVTLLIILFIRNQKERQPDPVQAGPGTPVNVPTPEPQISPSLQASPSPVQVQNKRSPTPQKQKPPVTYATLLPSAKPRGSRAQPFELPPDASTVPVGLVLVDPTNFKTYDLTLKDEAGTELDRWSNVEAQRFPAPAKKGLVIDVKTALLKPDESYRISVTGLNAKGERSSLEGYSFQAKK